ncbi:MAG: Cof-type HAD-IIB family hydrolase [Clostridiales bacterium]|nr:Cof-type HAD-IIB family hydrolase [Clostridiales bacterium]
MQKFRNVLLATDLDGTLLNSNREVDDENLDAIHYFVQNGGIFTASTGRSLSAARTILEGLPINAPVILYNGAVIYDIKTENVLTAKYLDNDYLKTAEEVMKKFPDVGVEFYTVDRTYLSQYSEVTKLHFDLINEPLVLTPIDDVRPPLVKGLFTQVPERLAEVKQYLVERYEEKYSITSSSPYLLEITNKNVNKGIAVLELAEHLDINTENICVIGDGLNDLEMIRAVEMSCTPENAVNELKEHAAYIVSDNEHYALKDTVALLNEKY